MLTLFKPYGTTGREENLYGDLVNVVGVTQPIGPARDAEIREKIRTCDILEADVDIPINKELLKDAENLKAVLCNSIGTDYVNIKEVTELGIPVGNNPDFCIEAVAEYAIGLMFAIARKIPKAADGVADGNWLIRRVTGGMEILGKTFGLIGFGRIGREVARMAKGLGMEVIAYDAYMNPEAARAMGVEPVGLEEIYERADVISIHAPLTEGTRGLIDKAAIEKMKDGAYLINVSRGGIVVEQDLADAIKEKKLGGVALDVLEQEPPEADHPLLGLIDENVVITPHTAWNTWEADKKADDHFGVQLRAVIAGQTPPALLNPETIHHPRHKGWYR
ncbi:MAG: hydroxyacid dehydrogenase [Firmicutes bacterium]|nr:hydroxyacid dehydrogenase [Bacillota bacterium]